MPESNDKHATLEKLLSNNRAWAAKIKAQNPEFFKTLAAQQSPEYMWIGCSDSRVPANELLGVLPGEVFVHRNIANLVVHTDLNCLSVLQFAIDVLGVKHIIVCGHYGCSGVHAAMVGRRVGLADNWLHHVQDVHQKHARYFGEDLSDCARHDRLTELNVIEQVANVCRTTIVRDAWERGQELTVHSWVYGLQDGLLRELGVDISSQEEIPLKLKEAFQRYETDKL